MKPGLCRHRRGDQSCLCRRTPAGLRTWEPAPDGGRLLRDDRGEDGRTHRVLWPAWRRIRRCDTGHRRPLSLPMAATSASLSRSPTTSSTSPATRPPLGKPSAPTSPSGNSHSPSSTASTSSLRPKPIPLSKHLREEAINRRTGPERPHPDRLNSFYATKKAGGFPPERRRVSLPPCQHRNAGPFWNNSRTGQFGRPA